MKLAKINNNEPLSSLSHFLGFLLAGAALPLLLVAAVKNGTVWHVVSYSIFGASLLLLYLTSAVYHFIPRHHFWRGIFKRIDHSMIFVLIAGTYTPICLTLLRGSWGWVLFVIIWSIAWLGILLKILDVKIKSYVLVFIYLSAGWTIVIFIKPLFQFLSQGLFFWLFLGGVFYSLGTIFFGLDRLLPRWRWFGMHEIFHLFVLAGSFSHFWLMFNILK